VKNNFQQLNILAYTALNKQLPRLVKSLLSKMSAASLCPPLLFSILQSCTLHVFNNFHCNHFMNSNCADLFNVLMPKTLYLINETHVGNNSYKSIDLQPQTLLHSPMDVKTQHVICTLYLILPAMMTPSNKALTSMLVLRTIEKTHLDPNYIFLELSDNDILQSDKNGGVGGFRLQNYSLTSTFILFDSARINIFSISCGSKNNYISIRRDADEISSLVYLFRCKAPNFNGLPMGTTLYDTTIYKSHIESSNNMNPIPSEYCVLNLLRNKLNFSIDPSSLNISGMISYGYLSNWFTRLAVTTPSSKKMTMSSNAIHIGEFHVTVFTLTRLNLYTVLLPFDEESWSCLSAVILAILTFIAVNNGLKLNCKSAQLIILWMLHNIFEQDDSTTTKQACGYKPIIKYIVVLWSLCSMYIGWVYKGYVSSEITINFPSSIPNSLQQILDKNMTILTITLSHSNEEGKRSHLHKKIADLLNLQNNVDFSPEYLQFLSSLNHNLQSVNLVLGQFSCSNTQKITRLKNTSKVLDSWSVISYRPYINWLKALLDMCSNFTSVDISYKSRKFPETMAWLGFKDVFFKIVSNKLSHLTQSGIYYYWNKDFVKKLQVVELKKFARKMEDSASILVKAKNVVRKLIAEIDRYQTVFKLNPITLINVYMPLIVFGALCCSCSVVFLFEIARVHFLRSKFRLLRMKFELLVKVLVKVLERFIIAKQKALSELCFKSKIGITNVKAF